MATRKTTTKRGADARPKTTKGASRSTVSGPSKPASPELAGNADALQSRMDNVGAAAAAMPYNPNKAIEYGEPAYQPDAGATVDTDDPSAGASTLTEGAASPKVGDGKPVVGVNVAGGNLDRVRADSTGRLLTTNQGVPVAQNQDSLKAGLRGPALLEDFILREKITHFDHERIPERVVHARGSAAHGYFESYGAHTELTRASIFASTSAEPPGCSR